MPHSRFSNEEIARRGAMLYHQQIAPKVENTHNLGKVVVIDIETGDYEIDEDPMAATDRALTKHPNAALFGLRVGFDAVEGFGGGPQPIKR